MIPGRKRDVMEARVARAYIHALQFREREGRWPTGRELGGSLGCSPNSALDYIRHLVAAGMMSTVIRRGRPDHMVRLEATPAEVRAQEAKAAIVAEKGRASYGDVAKVLGVSRERVRQLLGGRAHRAKDWVNREEEPCDLRAALALATEFDLGGAVALRRETRTWEVDGGDCGMTSADPDRAMDCALSYGADPTRVDLLRRVLKENTPCG